MVSEGGKLVAISVEKDDSKSLWKLVVIRAVRGMCLDDEVVMTGDGEKA